MNTIGGYRLLICVRNFIYNVYGDALCSENTFPTLVCVQLQRKIVLGVLLLPSLLYLFYIRYSSIYVYLINEFKCNINFVVDCDALQNKTPTQQAISYLTHQTAGIILLIKFRKQRGVGIGINLYLLVCTVSNRMYMKTGK